MSIYMVVISTIIWARVAQAGYGKWYVHFAFLALVVPEALMFLAEVRNKIRHRAQ